MTKEDLDKIIEEMKTIGDKIADLREPSNEASEGHLGLALTSWGSAIAHLKLTQHFLKKEPLPPLNKEIPVHGKITKIRR